MFKALLIRALLASALLAASPHSVRAHGGENHASPPAALPGFGAEGTAFQAVLVPAAGSPTLLYLADEDSNAPVAGAAIEAEAGDWQGRAEPTAEDGVYRLAWTPPAEGADVTLTVSHGGRDDLLLASGVRVRPGPAVSPAEPVAHWRHWAGGAVLGAVLVSAMVLLGRRRRRAAAVLACGLLAASGASAHEGHDAPAAAPSVLPGATVTMAKPAQFLLGIRTERVEPREAADSVRVVGHVVPDPGGFARVQPSQPARVVADLAFPLPVPGQAVRRGQVIAVLEPTLTSLERSDKRAALYRVESDIAIQEHDLARLEALANITPVKTIETARIRLEAARRERAQIAGTALGRELITAPIDGIVSDVHVVPGEVVASDRAMVEIIDPERVRVEAVIHDLALADRIVGATAASRQLGDEAVPLTLLGISPRVDPLDLGLHALFEVPRPQARSLKIGMPLDVFLATGRTRLRIAVPRDAVTEAGGRQVVFVRIAPEVFEARPVKVERVIGPLAELADGAVRPGERVAVQGVEQLRTAR